MNTLSKSPAVKDYYSYQDCWNYAFSLRENIDIGAVKNDIINLCYTVPEIFWKNFSQELLSATDYTQICHNLNKYLKENCPVSYLTNQVYFYGLNFYIEKGVFIPQKDTEILVEKTLELVDKIWKQKEMLTVLEIGTGCGNVVIPLAKEKPNWSFVAIDLNQKPLKIAQINASIQQVSQVSFWQSNLFDNLAKNQKFDIIISNPPYVSDTEYENISESVRKQPKEAVVAEDDGYFFYQKIFQKARFFLKKKFLLIVEIGHRQKEKVIKLVIKYFAQMNVSIFPDWGGRPRVVGIYLF